MIPIKHGPFFVGIGTLALINTALAKIGGGNALAYFVTSLFLGPLVTLYFVLTFKRPI